MRRALTTSGLSRIGGGRGTAADAAARHCIRGAHPGVCVCVRACACAAGPSATAAAPPKCSRRSPAGDCSFRRLARTRTCPSVRGCARSCFPSSSPFPPRAHPVPIRPCTHPGSTCVKPGWLGPCGTRLRHRSVRTALSGSQTGHAEDTQPGSRTLAPALAAAGKATPAAGHFVGDGGGGAGLLGGSPAPETPETPDATVLHGGPPSAALARGRAPRAVLLAAVTCVGAATLPGCTWHDVVPGASGRRGLFPFLAHAERGFFVSAPQAAWRPRRPGWRGRAGGGLGARRACAGRDDDDDLRTVRRAAWRLRLMWRVHSTHLTWCARA